MTAVLNAEMRFNLEGYSRIGLEFTSDAGLFPSWTNTFNFLPPSPATNRQLSLDIVKKVVHEDFLFFYIE